MAKKTAKKMGTATSGIETSARYRKKQERRLRAQEAAWEEKSGPVLIRIGSHEIYAKSQAKQDIEAARNLLLQAIKGESVRPRT
jgi:hypothetical protein